MTIYVGSNRADAAESAISKAVRAFKPIKLKTLEVGHSSEFIKTLFVQFATNTELRQLNGMIGQAAEDSSHYELEPLEFALQKDACRNAARIGEFN